MHEDHHGNGQHEEDFVSILIDNKEYKAPEFVMTGQAIKSLAGVGQGYDLWLEEHGKDDDRLISDSDVIELHNGMRFITAPSNINPGA